jgi:multiple antibiotic resistance protein
MPPIAAESLVAFGSLFSIVDPFSAVPVYLALMGAQPRPAQERTAVRASLTCLLVLTAFALAGTFIFTFFSITIPAFKIAGGILLFGVGLEMMRGKHSGTRSTEEEEREAESKEDVGLIPLGLPLLSGPGAIATVMVLSGKARSLEQRASVYVAIFATALSAFLILRSASLMARVLGRTGINVIGRIMGLILAAIAIQFVIDGGREAFPRLLG